MRLADGFDARGVLTNLRYDVPASLVVFLVALPLSLGIAIASGAPLMAGLIAAVVGGIVGGALGGSALQVSGPAAGLTVVVDGLITDFGWQTTCLITIAAGLIQISFGLLKVARAALGVAPVVVHAMLAGIGVTICLQQIHVLLGGESRSSAWENLRELPNELLHHELHEVIVGGTVIVILLLWPKLPPKLRFVPGALVAIVLATVLASTADLQVDRINLSGNFFQALSLPDLGARTPSGQSWVHQIGPVIIGVITVALIASVESLLSAVGIDKLHQGPRANFNREMIGQGSANIVSGLLGGLPVTGVIVRSSTNVAAGARSRTSAILHGVWVLLFASLFTGLVAMIPKSALAGLLIVIGIQLIKLAHIKLAWRTGNFAIYTITMGCVVFLNLLEGVAIGLALAILMLLIRIVRAPIEVMPVGGDDARQWRIDIDGTLSFLLLPRLTTVLATLPQGSHVTLRLNADYIDDAVSDAISDWQRSHEAAGGAVVIIETSPAHLSSTHTSRPKRHYAPHLPNQPDHPAYVHHPQSVVLTCADSPVSAEIVTASARGDLYKVCNVGNVVPTDPAERSVDAALDFAVNQLGVSSVVVCGHSSCDAMTALLSGLQDGDDPAATPAGRWLDYADDSLDAYQDHHPTRLSAESHGFAGIDQLSLVNVAVQTERLARHPILASAVAAGSLQVLGLFFDSANGVAYQLDHEGVVGRRTT